MRSPFTLPPRHTWIDQTLEIDTDADTLYLLLSDIERWAEWTPGLRAIKRLGRGPVAPGMRFVMVMAGPGPGLPLPCVVYHNTTGLLEWGGGGLGSCIRHRMELTPLGPGRTRLRHVEYATGLLALLTWPVAKLATAHDERWSAAIAARFALR